MRTDPQNITSLYELCKLLKRGNRYDPRSASCTWFSCRNLKLIRRKIAAGKLFLQVPRRFQSFVNKSLRRWNIESVSGDLNVCDFILKNCSSFNSWKLIHWELFEGTECFWALGVEVNPKEFLRLARFMIFNTMRLCDHMEFARCNKKLIPERKNMWGEPVDVVTDRFLLDGSENLQTSWD